MASTILDHRPDLILHRGKIVTVDSRFSLAEAVAIKDGRFLGVGDDADILALAGPNTRKIDLEGRTVLPGLIDTHNHQSATGTAMLKVSLAGSTCIADIVSAIQGGVESLPPGQWVPTAMVGEPAISHLLAERRYPTRWDLDPVSPHHPVCIVAPHVLILNSHALRVAGLTADIPDPDGGRIGRDPDTGELTGLLYEAPAMALVNGLLPRDTHDDRVRGLKLACRAHNAVGLTGILEHGVDFDDLYAYQEVWRKGDLTVRSYLHLWLDPQQPLAELERFMHAIAVFAAPGFGDDYLKVGGIKLIFDGGVGIGTALMRQPYLNASGQMSYGVQTVDTDKFREIVRIANNYGLRVAQHDSGGGAIDIVLDVYKQVDAERSIRDKRFVMVHCQFPSRENFEAIRELGAVVVAQTVSLYTMGLGYLKFLGKELADTGVPMRDWMESGLPVSLGSDAPVSSYDPLLGIWHAVTRQEKVTGEVIGADQRLTREEAIRCYTREAAYASFEENRKGSIEAGKLADLVVLSDDILTCPEDEIRNCGVMMTMVGGRVVYEA